MYEIDGQLEPQIKSVLKKRRMNNPTFGDHHILVYGEKGDLLNGRNLERMKVDKNDVVITNPPFSNVLSMKGYQIGYLMRTLVEKFDHGAIILPEKSFVLTAAAFVMYRSPKMFSASGPYPLAIVNMADHHKEDDRDIKVVCLFWSNDLTNFSIDRYTDMVKGPESGTLQLENGIGVELSREEVMATFAALSDHTSEEFTKAMVAREEYEGDIHNFDVEISSLLSTQKQGEELLKKKKEARKEKMMLLAKQKPYMAIVKTYLRKFELVKGVMELMHSFISVDRTEAKQCINQIIQKLENLERVLKKDHECDFCSDRILDIKHTFVRARIVLSNEKNEQAKMTQAKFNSMKNLLVDIGRDQVSGACKESTSDWVEYNGKLFAHFEHPSAEAILKLILRDGAQFKYHERVMLQEAIQLFSEHNSSVLDGRKDLVISSLIASCDANTVKELCQRFQYESEIMSRRLTIPMCNAREQERETHQKLIQERKFEIAALTKSLEETQARLAAKDKEDFEKGPSSEEHSILKKKYEELQADFEDALAQVGENKEKARKCQEFEEKVESVANDGKERVKYLHEKLKEMETANQTLVTSNSVLTSRVKEVCGLNDKYCKQANIAARAAKQMEEGIVKTERESRERQKQIVENGAKALTQLREDKARAEKDLTERLEASEKALKSSTAEVRSDQVPRLLSKIKEHSGRAETLTQRVTALDSQLQRAIATNASLEERKSTSEKQAQEVILGLEDMVKNLTEEINLQVKSVDESLLVSKQETIDEQIAEIVILKKRIEEIAILDKQRTESDEEAAKAGRQELEFLHGSVFDLKKHVLPEQEESLIQVNTEDLPQLQLIKEISVTLRELVKTFAGKGTPCWTCGSTTCVCVSNTCRVCSTVYMGKETDICYGCEAKEKISSELETGLPNRGQPQKKVTFPVKGAVASTSKGKEVSRTPISIIKSSQPQTQSNSQKPTIKSRKPVRRVSEEGREESETLEPPVSILIPKCVSFLCEVCRQIEQLEEPMEISRKVCRKCAIEPADKPEKCGACKNYRCTCVRKICPLCKQLVAEQIKSKCHLCMAKTRCDVCGTNHTLKACLFDNPIPMDKRGSVFTINLTKRGNYIIYRIRKSLATVLRGTCIVIHKNSQLIVSTESPKNTMLCLMSYIGDFSIASVNEVGGRKGADEAYRQTLELARKYKSDSTIHSLVARFGFNSLPVADGKFITCEKHGFSASVDGKNICCTSDSPGTVFASFLSRLHERMAKQLVKSPRCVEMEPDTKDIINMEVYKYLGIPPVYVSNGEVFFGVNGDINSIHHVEKTNIRGFYVKSEKKAKEKNKSRPNSRSSSRSSSPVRDLPQKRQVATVVYYSAAVREALTKPSGVVGVSRKKN